MDWNEKLKLYPTPADFDKNKKTFSPISMDDGYIRFYAPDCPLSSGTGILFYSRFVMSLHLGRWLTPDELIHYKDGNRANVEISNLEIVTRSDLGRMRNTSVLKFCEYCGQPFEISVSHFNRRTTCCVEHMGLKARKFNPTKEELEILVWRMSMVKVGELYGVSDVAVKKRCKLLGINTPYRGYWRKLECEQMRGDIEELSDG
jgi:hypothetical protein